MRWILDGQISLEAIQILLDGGAFLDAISKNGKTVFDCLLGQKKECERLILEDVDCYKDVVYTRNFIKKLNEVCTYLKSFEEKGLKESEHLVKNSSVIFTELLEGIPQLGYFVKDQENDFIA